MIAWRRSASTGIWIATLASLALAGTMAGLMVLMATSLEPTDLLSAGVEPYTDALFAASTFAGLVVVAAIGLRLWHSVRFKAIGALLTVGEVGAVVWACVLFYRDYL